MDIFAISGLSLGITSLFLGGLVLIKGRKEKTKLIWAIFCFSVSAWGFGGYKISFVESRQSALLWWKIVYIGIIFIPVIFFHFVHSFTGLKRKIELAAFYLWGIFFLILEWTRFSYLFFGPDNITYLFKSFYWVYPPSFLFAFFVFSWFGIVVYSHIILLNSFRNAKGARRVQMYYFIVGMALAFIGGGCSFLPCFGIAVYPYLNFLTLFYPIIVTYAITRYNLMDVKVITTELTVILLVLINLLQAISSATMAQVIFRMVILAFTVVVGYSLIKSVHKEVRSREQIEKLAKKLKKANEKLKKMDETKSEFISIASHQLRTPLTVIKGYVSMILQRDFGHISNKMNDVLEKVFISNERLIILVRELLNLSRIEKGRMDYGFKKGDLGKIVSETIEELSAVISDKGLKCVFKKDELPLVWMDETKIREVVMNLLDNAIKYTPKGALEVSLKKEGDTIVFAVKDSGVGLDKDDMKKLFQRFSRVNNKLEITGTGIGLYVVKKIIQAHKGDVFVKSKGRGHGSTFGFYLPINGR